MQIVSGDFIRSQWRCCCCCYCYYYHYHHHHHHYGMPVIKYK